MFGPVDVGAIEVEHSWPNIDFFRRVGETAVTSDQHVLSISRVGM